MCKCVFIFTLLIQIFSFHSSPQMEAESFIFYYFLMNQLLGVIVLGFHTLSSSYSVPYLPFLLFFPFSLTPCGTLRDPPCNLASCTSICKWIVSFFQKSWGLHYPYMYQPFRLHLFTFISRPCSHTEQWQKGSLHLICLFPFVSTFSSSSVFCRWNLTFVQKNTASISHDSSKLMK